jgi:hypothetical protein
MRDIANEMENKLQVLEITTKNQGNLHNLLQSWRGSQAEQDKIFQDIQQQITSMQTSIRILCRMNSAILSLLTEEQLAAGAVAADLDEKHPINQIGWL